MYLLRVFTALLLTLLLTACGQEPVAPQNGQPAPGFTLERLETGQLAFPADTKGKVVAVRFWADWCPFCEHEMKELEPVYQKYRDKGLVILAINVNQERPVVEKFTVGLGITYNTLLDKEGAVARQYVVMGLPTTFFVDRQGVLRSKILGESTAETFERIILDLL